MAGIEPGISGIESDYSILYCAATMVTTHFTLIKIKLISAAASSKTSLILVFYLLLGEPGEKGEKGEPGPSGKL